MHLSEYLKSCITCAKKQQPLGAPLVGLVSNMRAPRSSMAHPRINQDFNEGISEFLDFVIVPDLPCLVTWSSLFNGTRESSRTVLYCTVMYRKMINKNSPSRRHRLRDNIDLLTRCFRPASLTYARSFQVRLPLTVDPPTALLTKKISFFSFHYPNIASICSGKYEVLLYPAIGIIDTSIRFVAERARDKQPAVIHEP